MRKKELAKLRVLKATPTMMRLASEDIPKRTTYTLYGYTHTVDACRYGLFMRCAVIGGILKVAVFLPKSMRLKSRMPAYEIFFDNQNRCFLTFDYEKQKWLTGKLDRIEWNRDRLNASEHWISEKDAKTVSEYLGTKDGGYYDILRYQWGIRAEELKKRHKKETDLWDADLEQTPATPKDWNRWLGKVGIREHFIFYEYSRRGAKTGYCSYCEMDVPIQNPRHNKTGVCPRCHHKITFKAVGRADTFETDRYCVYLLQPCRDGMMIRFFIAARQYRKGKYANPDQWAREERRAIYDRFGKPLRAYYWGLYRQTETRWVKGSAVGNWYSYNDYSGRVYGKTIPNLVKRGLSRTGFAEYLKRKVYVDPEHYFGVLQSLPQLEQLSKAGLARMADECLRSTYDFKEMLKGRTASSLTKALGIDSQELKRLRENNGGVAFLAWLQYEKATGKAIPDNVISWFCKEDITLGKIKFIADRMSMTQIYRYIRRNMAMERMTSREVITTWADYLSMAVRFGYDTTDEIVYRTRKLKQRHDELAIRGINKDIAVQAGEVLTKFPHVDEICRSLSSKYAYAGKDYVILAPSSIEEIIQEGHILHHCIANIDRYWERMEKHESYLLFLRKTDEPQKAYYTMEIEPGGTVRQIRTYYDRQNKDIEEARAFLREWQKVITDRLTEDDRKKADTSRILRNREFIQLKADQVKIHTGALAGRLLVDVLTADLLENAAA